MSLRSSRSLRCAALRADRRWLGGRIGALAVLHTWTRTLEWHPHVHMVVPAGALAPDGRTWLGPIVGCDEHTVRVAYRDSRDHQRKCMALPVQEFLRRFAAGADSDLVRRALETRTLASAAQHLAIDLGSRLIVQR